MNSGSLPIDIGKRNPLRRLRFAICFLSIIGFFNSFFAYSQSIFPASYRIRFKGVSSKRGPSKSA